MHIKIGGSDAPVAMMEALRRVEIDRSLHLPGMATIEIVDSELKWVDDTSIAVGAEIEISFKSNRQIDGEAAPESLVFKGVISAHEPEYVSQDQYCIMVIRAYDRLHLLHRGTGTKTFLNSTDSDVASSVIGEAGLSAQVQSTSTTHDHIFRGDLSSYEFLQQLARRNGFIVLFDGGSVHWKPADALNFATVTAEYGKDLIEFRPVLSSTGQVNEVSVQGWDPAQKTVVTATVTSPTLAPTSTGEKRGPALAQSAFNSSKLHIGSHHSKQPVAQAIATATLNRFAASDMTAEGILFGNPAIKPGGKLVVQKVGTRFSGTYLVTRVRHTYTVEDALMTHVALGGMTSGTLGTLITDNPADTRSRSAIASGVAVGIVTNNNDPDDSGRVKVKFPWLSDQDESSWAPVMGIGAGDKRGFYVLPEVNDEVLVAFANADLNHPYVIGGLWNGRDKTPSPVGTAVSGGAVVVRELKTRVGHVLRFTDTSGSEKIELIDKTNKNSLVIESSSGNFTINCTGAMTIKAGQDVKIEASANVDIKATAEVKVHGASISVEATGKLGLKAPSIEIAGSGMVKISGPMVQIN